MPERGGGDSAETVGAASRGLVVATGIVPGGGTGGTDPAMLEIAQQTPGDRRHVIGGRAGWIPRQYGYLAPDHVANFFITPNNARERGEIFKKLSQALSNVR